MITVLTGQPGNGKTLWVIQQIIKDIESGRLVYTVGIPKITLPVITLNKQHLIQWHEREPIEGSFNDETEEPVYRLKNIDEGAKIYVDEAQKIFPAMGTKTDDYIEYLCEHRHHGLDFVFISQFPSLLHGTVKALVTQHFHIRYTWAGRKIYEWPELQSDPKSKTSLEVAYERSYKLDNKLFKYYESASQHTKVSHSTPFKFYFFMAVFIAMPFLLYLGYTRIMHKVNPDKDHFLAAAGVKKEQNNLNLQSNYLQKTSSKLSYCTQTELNCTCYTSEFNVFNISKDTCIKLAKSGF